MRPWISLHKDISLQVMGNKKPALRRLIYLGAAAVLLLVLGLAALWQSRVALAERAIADALAARGVAPVSFRVSMLGLRSIEIADLAIGPGEGSARQSPDVEAGQITVMYRLGELISGRVQSIEISNLTAHALVDEHGLSLGAASRLLEGGGGGAAGPLPAIHVDGARIELATPQGRFALDGSLDLSKPDAAAPVAISFPSLRLSDLAAPLRFEPVEFVGGGTLDGSKLGFSAVARSAAPGAGGAELAKLAGSYDLAGLKGAVRAQGALSFAPAGLEPQTLLPVLKGLVANVQGKANYEAELSFASGGLRSSGRVVLSGIGFEAYSAKFGGLDGTVVLDSLAPPRSRGIQTLSVGLVEAGVPLKDGRVAFEIGRSGLPHLVSAAWPFADGRLSLASTSAGADAFELTVENVDVASLLMLVDVPGLSGSGKLSGTIPVAIENGNPIIRDGALAAAAGGGVIVYKSAAADAAAGNEQTKLLTEALKDFHYTELKATLSGNANGELQFRLHFKGSNPSLYGGYPIVLNVNLQGSLAELIRRGTVGFRPMELIRSEVAPTKKATP